MNRRRFLKILGLASLAASGLHSLAVNLPKRVIHAIKSGKYPGKIIPIDEKEIAKPGKWLG